MNIKIATVVEIISWRSILAKKYINKKFKQKNESFQEIGSESIKKN